MGCSEPECNGPMLRNLLLLPRGQHGPEVAGELALLQLFVDVGAKGAFSETHARGRHRVVALPEGPFEIDRGQPSVRRIDDRGRHPGLLSVRNDASERSDERHKRGRQSLRTEASVQLINPVHRILLRSQAFLQAVEATFCRLARAESLSYP